MAIAGLHNVSVLDSPFVREHQPSRQNGDERGPSTRASSLLQMWRELEHDHVVSGFQDRYGQVLHQRRNDRMAANMSSVNTPQNHGSEQMAVLEGQDISRNVNGLLSCDLRGADHEQRIQNDSTCGRSDDFGEVERERIEGHFQEWMNCSRRERASDVFHTNNHCRAEWLVETAQENMRITRESAQMNSEQRGACHGNREEQETEMGGRMGRVLDGIVNQNRDWTEHIRRGNRRLCGKQVLLDMLGKAKLERIKELQNLIMCKAVSEFAYRNRIQSLLRGRFLRNDRIIEDKRPSSWAASELGLLRQRSTVSGLREGFISIVERSGSGQMSRSYSDTLSNSDISSNADDETQAHNSHVVLDGFHEPSLPNNQESDRCGLRDGDRSDLEGNRVEDISSSESHSHAEECHEQDSEHEARDKIPSSGVEGSNVTRLNMDGNWQETSCIVLQNQEGGHSHPREVGQLLSEEPGPIDWLPSASVEGSNVTRQNMEEARQVLAEQSEAISDISTANVLFNHADIVEGSTDWQEISAQLEEPEEQAQENEDTDWQGASIEYNERRDGFGGDIDRNQQGRFGNEWFQEMSASQDREEGYREDSPEEWHNDGSFQEAVQNWIEEPSDHQSVSLGRIDMFDSPDGDNANSTELRELQSRRRVSNLLESGFHARLDHLIQSYVDRQSRAPIDWELHRTLTSPSGEQDLELQSRDQIDSEGVAAGSPSLALPSSTMIPVQSILDRDSHSDDWQPLGIEWEIINDMRLDIARLQQRMNYMQTMLEACMDMQLELQSSIRQEVSAALNRSATSPGVHADGFSEDGSKWDHIRTGRCCICRDTNIDSLLYRCGHMCACFECANGLVQSGGKCPMCLAPVAEVIRAYCVW